MPDDPVTPIAPDGEGPDTGAHDPDWKAEAEKWKAMSRKHETAARANADAARRLQEMEDRDKSDVQKLTDKIAAAEQRAAEAESRALRFAVAADKHVPADYLEFLTGDTQEELEAKADKLLALSTTPGGSPGPSGARPKENLRPGALPNDGVNGRAADGAASMNSFIRAAAGRQ